MIKRLRLPLAPILIALTLGLSAAFAQAQTVQPTDLLWMTNDGEVAATYANTDNTLTTVYDDGPFSGWGGYRVALGRDGITRVLWVDQGGTAYIDFFRNGQRVADYQDGPFPYWHPMDISVGPDGNTRLLWFREDGAVAISFVSASGQWLADYVDGPYGGWIPEAIDVGPDNASRLLWVSNSGAVSVNYISGSAHFLGAYDEGPYNGWLPLDIAVTGDGSDHILWKHADREIIVEFNAASNSPYYARFGPFSSWDGIAIAGGYDNYLRLLWMNDADGSAAVFYLDQSATLAGLTQYGPYSTWSPWDIATVK